MNSIKHNQNKNQVQFAETPFISVSEFNKKTTSTMAALVENAETDVRDEVAEMFALDKKKKKKKATKKVC